MFEHRQISLNDTEMHCVSAGSSKNGVIFCHGFPELWYSWHHQLQALSEAGYMAIAPDMQGYGGSSKPDRVDEYSMEKLTGRLDELISRLKEDHGLEKVALIGHDWGGGLVWSTFRHYRSNINAIGSLNTPYFGPSKNSPLVLMRKRPGKLAYQLYFMEEGLAEKELGEDLALTFNLCFQSSSADPQSNPMHHTEKVSADSGFLGAFKEGLPADFKGDLVSEEKLKLFVEQYSQGGFRGPLNWYRNYELNWQFELTVDEPESYDMPALMITASHDPVLTPRTAEPMKKKFTNLTMHQLECGHWTQQEKPQEVNKILIDWLNDVL